MDEQALVKDLRNLGQESAYWLNKVGIYTLGDLKKDSTQEIMRKLEQVGFKPSKNMMYAIEGALVDKDWRDIAKAYNDVV